jgi:hypothetical protein
MRLVWGYTLGNVDHYTSVITKRRANLLIKQLFRPDLEHRAATIREARIYKHIARKMACLTPIRCH